MPKRVRDEWLSLALCHWTALCLHGVQGVVLKSRQMAWRFGRVFWICHRRRRRSDCRRLEYIHNSTMYYVGILAVGHLSRIMLASWSVIAEPPMTSSALPSRSAQ